MSKDLTRVVPMLAFLSFAAWALSIGHTSWAACMALIAVLALP